MVTSRGRILAPAPAGGTWYGPRARKSNVTVAVVEPVVVVVAVHVHGNATVAVVELDHVHGVCNRAVHVHVHGHDHGAGHVHGLLPALSTSRAPPPSGAPPLREAQARIDRNPAGRESASGAGRWRRRAARRRGR